MESFFCGKPVLVSSLECYMRKACHCFIHGVFCEGLVIALSMGFSAKGLLLNLSQKPDKGRLVDAFPELAAEAVDHEMVALLE